MRKIVAIGIIAVVAILLVSPVQAGIFSDIYDFFFMSEIPNENVIVGITFLSAAPGATVTVPITIHNVTDFAAGTINITYDPSVCNVTDVTAGALPMLFKNIGVPGLAIISALDTEGHSGDVVFANLEIEAVGWGVSSLLNISVDALGTSIVDGHDLVEITNYSMNNGTFTILSSIITYGDGGCDEKVVYADGRIDCIKGVRWFIRWDGVNRPWSELDMSSGNYHYLVEEFDTYYLLTRGNDNLTLQKNFGSYTFGINKIGVSFTVTPQQLKARSTLHNWVGVDYWYIPIPQSFVQTTKQFNWDHRLPQVFNESGNTTNQSNFAYHRVGGQLRFYYNEEARNFGATSSLITFNFNSWIVNGSIGSAWTNVSHDNTTAMISTGNVELRREVDDEVSYWSFNEGTGNTAYDQNLTSENNGSFINGSTGNWTASSKYGDYAVDFDGTDDCVEVTQSSSINNLDNLTISIWIYMDSYGEGGIGRIAEKPGAFTCFVYNGTGDNEVWFGANRWDTEGRWDINNVFTGQWYHIAVTYNYSSIANDPIFYLNGIQQSVAETTPPAGSKSSETGMLYIGNRADKARTWDGLIDEVRIYNRVLSNDEINQTMENEHRTDGNLTSWHDGGSGNEIYKLSVNFTFPANTNDSINLYNNDTRAFIETLATQTTTADWNATITSPVQDSKVNITLYGNVSQTPQIINITYYAQAAGVLLVLTTGNISNIQHDWGQDWSSNFSANVTIANASNVWMNFTHIDFTNTSLGNLNLTIDEWVNESHNIGIPVTNISVTIYLNSTTSGVANDTDTFYYEITKRSNTATMDSSATQTVGINDDFYINGTCNEEYGDTFYGAADLLEDGTIIFTNSSIVDYVNFTWNKSTTDVYNYTVRFYNLTHYDNGTSGYSNVTVVGPTLTTGNIQNYEEDWGRDWNSNFSANVTGANASEVWMNFTNAKFTNTSLGWLNRTLDEWVNESHNVAAPVMNVSVTVELTSTASGATNDSDTFYYEITNRTNTATMDSNATQSVSINEDFFINATCNEEYGDTFYGAANLLEDGATVSTNSSVVDYVNFTWNESSAGQYNYTVRFYNISHYDNVTMPTYSNVTVSAPIVTLLSQSPSELYQNSTGCLNISYGISHSSSGLNNTSVSFIYTVYNPVDDTYNHSIRVPSNNRSALESVTGEWILRADNRNSTSPLNFEDNATITRGNVYEWGGGDENTTRLTIEPVNSTYTLVHWNGTIRDTASIDTWYLDRTEQENATMTNLDIHKSSRPCIKIWNLETIYGHDDYLFNFYMDTDFSGASPDKPIFLYYLNSSYDPEGSVNPEDSPYGFFVTSHNATTWVDYLYELRNSSYIKAFSVNQSAIVDSGVVTTNTAWVCFNTETSQSKPYSLNMTNDPTSTNKTFGECNVTWVGNNAPLAENLYTINAFVSDRHRGHQFKHQLYIADNVGTWANSTINTTDIEKAYFPPTKPAFAYFYYQNEKDLDMNYTYSGTFDIGIALSTDPDDGDVAHNLSLHYGNRTFIAIINNTFNDTMRDNTFINISFDSSSYYSSVDNFTLQVNATDDEGVSIITWLDVNFTLNPPTLTIGGEQNIKEDWGQDFSSNFSANVTGQNAKDVWMNFSHNNFTNTSLGWLNISINEWVNQSHNVGSPITNISVNITLNSTTADAINGTASFYYEITKRNNTATMDSAATQSVGINQDFFINASLIEEYSDTFYGGADLLEDEALILTNSSIIDYVNFTHNESVASVYNYTVRFYNLTHYNNATTPTYSNVTVSVVDYIPPDPINLTNTTGNFWCNFTWEAGSGNVTNSYNVSINDTWYNGSSNAYYNNSGLPAHAWSNITVSAWNSSGNGTLSSGSVSDNVQLPNNPITLSVTQSYTELEGQTIFISDTSSSDVDGDTPTYSCNRSDLFADFNTSTGYGNWTTGVADSGIYYVDIGVSDGYGSTDNKTLTITIIDCTPGSPTNLQNTTGNFWINHTWDAGANTDSFNVSVNSSWNNGTNEYYNNTGLTAHGWSNISVSGFNSTNGEISSNISENTQVPNNPVSISNCSDRGVIETQTVYVDIDSSDADGDTPTYSCNRTDLFANFSTSTGEGNWTTNTTNVGTYYIDFGVSDGYGSTDNCTMVITIAEGTPTPPTNLQYLLSGVNQTIDWTWTNGGNTDTIDAVLNGSAIGTITSPYQYTNSTLPRWENISIRGYNITTTEYSTWTNDTVYVELPPSVYNISGYVKNGTGSPIVGAYVVENITVKNDNTNASGFYNLSGLLNNTYLVTATKIGYTSNSTVVIISGSDMTNQNITLTEVVGAANITMWWNNYTNNNLTSFVVGYWQEANRTIFFNVSADQGIDYWVWYKDDVLVQNSSSDNYTATWDLGGSYTIKVYGINVNGETDTLIWNIKIQNTLYEQNLLLLEENEMIGTTVLFGILVAIAFLFLLVAIFGIGYEHYFDVLSAFISPTILMLLGYQCYSLEALQEFEFLGLLLVVIATIIYIYGIILIISIAMNEFGYGDREEDREADYEYK